MFLKLFITIFWVCFSTQIFCQSFSEAEKLFADGKLIEAKEQIETYLNTNDNDAKALLLKSRIYFDISKDAELNETMADAKSTAFSALQNAFSTNENLVLSNLKDENYSYTTNLLNSFKSEAIILFNSAAQRNDKDLFEKAFTHFKKVLTVGEYLYQKKCNLTEIDSNSLLYTVKAAAYCQKPEDGLLYAKRITDHNIVSTIENKSFEQVYQWMVFYYRQKNDVEFLRKYTGLGNSLFPQSTYFNLNFIDALREQNLDKALLEFYTALFKKPNLPNNYYQNYFIDLYRLTYSKQTNIADKKILIALFKKNMPEYLKKNPADSKMKALQIQYFKRGKLLSKTK